MSDQPERQYAENGKIIGECECGCYIYKRGVNLWVDQATGQFAVGGIICDRPDCGSYCDAEGHATPGVLVLWEGYGLLSTGKADACNGRAALFAQARAALAAREGVTP